MRDLPAETEDDGKKKKTQSLEEAFERWEKQILLGWVCEEPGERSSGERQDG